MRSMLFVPGDSPSKIEKALSSSADGIIIDLEDSVSLDAKQEARAVAGRILEALHPPAGDNPRPQIYVRVNPLDTGLTADDLAAVIPFAPDGVMQPKTRSVDDVHQLARLLDEQETAHCLDKGRTRLVVIATETATSLFHMGSYVNAGPRLAGLSWGAEDLSADLGASTNRTPDGQYADPYRLARSLCLLAAVAAEVQPIDTVFTNFRDDEGLRSECEAAARDGFTGKLAIHPAQLATINDVFTPSGDQIERAQAIVDAFESAGNPGVVGLNGEMLDRPHLVRARNLLARAKQYR